MTDQKTRRVFHFAQVLEGEAHEHENGRCYWFRPDHGSVVAYHVGSFSIACDWIPVNPLPETTEPVPPAPRTRTRIVFEECDEADWKGDAMGRWWYQPKGTVKIVYSTYELPAEKGIVYFNRTEETIPDEPPEPEVWTGVFGIVSTHARHIARITHSFHGEWFAHNSHLTREQAETDLASLKAAAKTYADHHNAVIEWEEAK